MTLPAGDVVFVETAARLHFGVLDLGGSLGRWFGGVGAAAPGPLLRVSASRADGLSVAGGDADRAGTFARRFLDFHQIDPGARIEVLQTLPAHAGLGSGTQLALAIARALAELTGAPTDAASLARAVGRAQRSAIGTWTFSAGGLVVEGGRRPESDEAAPVVARLPFPPSWRCVVAVPRAGTGVSGRDEEEAFARLDAPAPREAARVAHLVLMALLPALADGDLPAFGKALSAIQAITGQWFAAIQGGTFARGPSEDLVRRIHEWGACGVGQSSWGPAVYGIVDGEEAGIRLAERVRAALGSDGDVYQGPFRTEGARVWHTRSADLQVRRDGQA